MEKIKVMAQKLYFEREVSMKKILRVQPWYTIIMTAVVFICFVVFLFLGQIMNWEENSFSILWYFLIGICALIALAIFMYYLQFAIVDEKGILIRGLFYKIAILHWSDIKEITSEKVVTHNSRGGISLNWLIIKTDKKEDVHGRAGVNRRKKSPWTIIANVRNRTIIGNYYLITEPMSERDIQGIIRNLKNQK